MIGELVGMSFDAMENPLRLVEDRFDLSLVALWDADRADLIDLFLNSHDATKDVLPDLAGAGALSKGLEGLVVLLDGLPADRGRPLN